MRDDLVLEILRRQQSEGFPDLTGAEIAATIPISDRLIDDVIAAKLPAHGSVREVRVRAEAANQLLVNVRIATGPLNIPVNLTLVIDEQPEFPQRPVLVLRPSGLSGLLGFAGQTLRFLDFLPPGVSMDGGRIHVNLETVLARYGQANLLKYLTSLQVTTRPGAVVVSVRAKI